MRTVIWRRVDPSRCGILPNVFSESYGFGDYADFIGNVAPIFLPKGDEVEPTGSRTVAQIYEDHSPDREEIVHLLSMAFPDIRLKQYLEIRLADVVPQSFVSAYAAVIKGLLYSEEAIEYAQSQIRGGSLQEKDVIEAENAIMKDGWDSIVYGKSVREGAEEMLKMAERSLPENEKSYLGAFDLVIKRGEIARTPQD
jgi:glutamate--cysteine ligase